jgi:hypothetical protein
MYRLLALSGLAAAILTIPALAAAPDSRSPQDTIGFIVSDEDGAGAAAYWTLDRLAAAPEMPLPMIPGTPPGDTAS